MRITRDRRTLLATQHPGLGLCDANRRVLAHADITKRFAIHGLRRTATELLRRAAVDPVAAKAIIGHTTDRMREHDSTVNAEETRDIGTRVAWLVPAVRLDRGGRSPGWSARSRVRGTPPNTLVTNRNHFVYRRAGEGI